MTSYYHYHNGSWTKQALHVEDIRPEDMTWTERISEMSVMTGNILKIETREDHEALWGSHIYRQSLEDEADHADFQFYLDRDDLILMNIDVPKMFSYTEEELLNDKSRRSAVETFYIIIKNTTHEYMAQIDIFEQKLHKILWEVKERNNIKILNQVAEADHQLLLCKTQIVTVTELFMMTEEAFGKEVEESKYYYQMKMRVERARFLINAYEEEIDALLDFENLVSSYRGNEITKTLTIFTALFAPATLLGAIWGMNFKHMPELDWKLGYLMALLLMVMVTYFIYIYLKGKGWMGDLLDNKSHHKNKFF
ncbi:magnesium transporter CorA family protein [Macrococcus bovicus]|uniref:magnesium transporter CorA family protein n=1 Tax=Macrococcus bovicus TaxID=69968 RepID=UPI0025A50E26|nr:magnesium transporter CorA family protein [Macrococcus bovicus]WJP97647.1 magnesium transporter CorA family protein [Macrococcus bovicus]